MNENLLGTLKALPTDPARVVDLYPQLYASYFLVPVRSDADFETALFMIYPCIDGSFEVPVFTSSDYVFELPTEAVLLTARGDTLWPRLLELLRSEDLKECQVVVDPGQDHGFGLRKEAILGMIRVYGVR